MYLQGLKSPILYLIVRLSKCSPHRAFDELPSVIDADESARIDKGAGSNSLGVLKASELLMRERQH